ncbi:MAG: hypothetical protein P8X81_00730 [Woeseiaceae bacterium]|jgi:hypothetical protein
MDFFGPEPSDFANVRVLNHAWLLRLRESHAGDSLRQGLSPSIRQLIAGLTDLQVERLAITPFLVFSVCERDERCWQHLDTPDPNLDLWSGPGCDNDELRTSAISFLWQLAARNPYAARLVSGATLGWCERLAAFTLLDVLRAAAAVDDMLQPRFPHDEDFWRKLLGPGLSSDARTRHSAHITCLQWLLTESPQAGYRKIRAAACANPVPTSNVAEKPRP